MDPTRDAQLQQRECQVHRIPAEAIRTRLDDRRGGLARGYGVPAARNRCTEADLAAKERSLWPSGPLPPLARRKLTDAGWVVHERVPAAPG